MTDFTAFLRQTDLTPDLLVSMTGEALHGMDDGELFVEVRQSESLVLDDGRIKSAVFDSGCGFGLRGVVGEAQTYAHSSELSQAALKRAATTVQAAARPGTTRTMTVPLSPAPTPLYTADNPLALVPFERKIALLQEIDAYVRQTDPRVKQATVSLLGSWQAVLIAREDGLTHDIRPLVRLNVSVILEQNGRRETGSHGFGGRNLYDGVLSPERWRTCADEALRQASVNLESIPAPAGEMTVVLGAGWPGIMLHEAVGHGLEGDFNRKGSSVFSGRIGERVASKGVTVVDDGTIAGRRGSLTVDDEGTPTRRNVLIEDGILKGYINDRLNGRLLGTGSTGNGRRESYACLPMPRMTNTFMEAGSHSPDEIVASVKKGLYAVNFSGGQVDITSGKFVFSAAEAYLIENGKIGPAVKGATLIGSGPQAMTQISMIGNDLTLDPGIGTCGKDGQGVPVGVGQPTLKMDGLTVGGTQS